MDVKLKGKKVPYKLPKNMTTAESELLDQLLTNKVSASPKRKHPRNPLEKQTLKQWEKEREGEKIGEI